MYTHLITNYSWDDVVHDVVHDAEKISGKEQKYASDVGDDTRDAGLQSNNKDTNDALDDYDDYVA